MSVKKLTRSVLTTAILAISAQAAHAATDGVKITEWMYNAASGNAEYVELTNFGPVAIDFTGWSFDDANPTPGAENLSAFGVVQSGESVIFTEASAADFRAAWNLSSSVKVIGGVSNNLGRSDEINIFNGTTLIDRLTYNDQGSGNVKGPRTQGASGNPNSAAAIGANTASAWHLSTVGDIENSLKSVAAGGIVGGDIGNPGHSSYAPAVPVPAALPLLLSALSLMGIVGRKRRQT